MEEELKDQLKLLLEMRDNINKSGDALGLKDKYYDLEVPKIENPEYYLFTGREYHIAGALSEMAKYEHSFSLKVGLFMRKIGIDPLKIIIKSGVVKRFKEIPVKLFELLTGAGYKVSYNIQYDKYPGTLLWEYGFINDFKLYINNLFDVFKNLGVKKIVTISPHSTEVLKIVSKEYLENESDVEIIHYTDLLSKSDLKFRSDNIKVAYHDPCHLARVIGITEEPRELIKRCGCELLEHDYSKDLTTCCGAPVESIAPEVSKEIARKRINELKELGVDVIITACPFCLAILSSVAKSNDPKIIDLIEFLYERWIKT